MKAPEVVKSVRPRKQDHRFREEMMTEICGNRRSHRRYPLDLQLMYKVMKRYQVHHTGSGRTIDMSGNGISFETNEAIEPGSSVELSIAWPVLLNKTCSLKLIVTGRVVRSGPARAAIRMQGYEFRTKGSGTLHTMAAGSPIHS